jgi:hypothetical protein
MPWTWQRRPCHAAQSDAATVVLPTLCRIAHAEGAASRPASIMGFEEQQSEPAECGICLDAMEGVAVNGCSHRLCGEIMQRAACRLTPALLPFTCMHWYSIHTSHTLDSSPLCAHAVECALSLCELHKKPPLCPFCRLKIQGFHIVA